MHTLNILGHVVVCNLVKTQQRYASLPHVILQCKLFHSYHGWWKEIGPSIGDLSWRCKLLKHIKFLLFGKIKLLRTIGEWDKGHGETHPQALSTKLVIAIKLTKVVSWGTMQKCGRTCDSAWLCLIAYLSPFPVSRVKFFEANRACSTLIEPLLAHTKPSTLNVPPNPSSSPTKHLTYASKSFGSLAPTPIRKWSCIMHLD